MAIGWEFIEKKICHKNNPSHYNQGHAKSFTLFIWKHNYFKYNLINFYER